MTYPEDQSTKQEITRRLQAASAIQTHLSNIISGVNHEISPWLGGIINIINSLNNDIKDLGDNDIKKDIKEELLNSIKRIEYAAKQSAVILSMTSANIKKLQNYSNKITNLADTVRSWIKLTLLDTNIKDNISEKNIIIDENSLNFECTHSPMLLSQVILNLVKNSLEHNQEFIDTLKIKIYGNPKKKFMIIEDNGKGIRNDILSDLFSAGNTSKDINNETSHGLGLSACMDYCLSMGAFIWVSSEEGKFTKFIIAFDKEITRDFKKKDTKIKENYKRTQSDHGMPESEEIRKNKSKRLFTRFSGESIDDTKEDMP